jgi:hypothetical protein
MATDVPSNWSAPIVKAYLGSLLRQARLAPNVWRGVGDPMRIKVSYRPDELFPPTGTRGCWEISSYAPAGHPTTYFRQSPAEALDTLFSQLGDEIHYGPHSRADVYTFMEHVKLLSQSGI